MTKIIPQWRWSFPKVKLNQFSSFCKRDVTHIQTMHTSLLESSADAISRIYGTNKQTNALIDILLLYRGRIISYICICLIVQRLHRVSIEGTSPYNEYHIVDSRRKIFPSNLMTFWATIYHAQTSNFKIIHTGILFFH